MIGFGMGGTGTGLICAGVDFMVGSTNAGNCMLIWAGICFFIFGIGVMFKD